MVLATFRLPGEVRALWMKGLGVRGFRFWEFGGLGFRGVGFRGARVWGFGVLLFQGRMISLSSICLEAFGPSSQAPLRCKDNRS